MVCIPGFGRLFELPGYPKVYQKTAGQGTNRAGASKTLSPITYASFTPLRSGGKALLPDARLPRPRLRRRRCRLGRPACPYTLVMADEDTVLQEAMDNLKEAGQRIMATQSLIRSQGMTDGENYRDLLTRLSTALAMTEAAYLEARRRREL